MGRIKLSTLLAILVLALAGPAVAQFANADLEGAVTDESGAVLPGVTVTATNEATGLVRTTVTAGNGAYAVNGLKPGLYEVTFRLEGFQAVRQSGVVLRVGQETRVNATMQLGTIEEVLNVTATAPLVEVSSKEIGGTLSQDEIEALPTQNRSALLFASLMPGIIPSPSTESTASDALFVNGQDDNNNSFNVDGANNDDDVIGARAGAQARTPMEAIQEFQVLTTQFDAEFGRALGGVLNAVTKSGGNQLSGTAFALFQDSSFDQKNFFTERAGLDKPDTSYKTQGFTLGGPIVRDRLHFFVSYEDNLNEEGQIGNFPTRPDLNFSTTEDNDIENTLLKLDYQVSTHHHAVARYLLEESPQFNQIIPVNGVPVTLNAAREEDDTDSNWSVSFESVVSERAFNTFRFSFTKEDVSFANPGYNNNGQSFEAQRNQAPLEEHPGFVDGASAVAQSRFNRSTQVDDTYSLFLPTKKGEHELRFGFQYSEREEEFVNFGTLNGDFFGFEDDRPFDAGDITTYPGAFTLRVLGGLTADIPSNETLGLFVQDDWRIGDRVTLSLGLRYDEEDITDDSNVAPRLGFTWDPFGQGKTVVRGGYGRFYDRFQLGYFANFFLDAVDLPQGFILRFPDSGLDAQALFDVAQDNGVTSLTQLRDVLAVMLEGGAVAPINSRPTVDNPDRKQAYADTLSLGIEHEVSRGWALGADLIHARNRDTLVAVDLNPSSSSQGGRPNISILNGEVVPMGSITSYVNAAESDYTALQLQVKHRSARLHGRVSYTYADTDGNHEGGGGGTAGAYFQTRTETGYNFDTGTFLGAPPDPNLDDLRTRGIPTNWHRDHNLVISGTYLVPGTSWRENKGLELSWIYRYMTGDQVTLFSGGTFLDNGNRAPAPAGSYSASGSDIGRSESYDGKLRGAQNPDFSRLDLSLRYNIPCGGRFTAILVADVFNAFDETNFANLGSTREGTSTFLIPSSAFNPRQLQLGVRFEF